MLLVDSFSFLFPKKRKELMIVMRDECHNKMMIAQIESYYSCHHIVAHLLVIVPGSLQLYWHHRGVWETDRAAKLNSTATIVVTNWALRRGYILVW